MDIGGVPLELIDRGRGKPVLFLHPHIGLHGAEGFIELLAAASRVLAPSHPGFGRTPRPAGCTTVDDLSYFYLELAERLDLQDAVLAGSSFGAWIALEIAVKSTQRFSHLVLIDPVGAKFGHRETTDILDIFAHPEAKVNELAYHDPSHAAIDYGALNDDELAVIARNREAAGLYGWNPYMYNPKLRARLYRIRIPTLVLWGEADRMSPSGWGRQYAGAIPGDGRTEYREVQSAGHFPHIEQPAETAGRIAEFCELRQAAAA